MWTMADISTIWTEKTPWHDLPGEKHADQAIKVQLRSGLGIDASAVAGVKPEGGKENG